MNKIHSMMPAAVVIGLFAFLFASAFVSQRAFAVRSPQPPLHPRTYHSPSGEFSLFVNPSDRQGRGSAEYRLLKGNTEVWHGERPFTLCDVRLLDDGTAAGYGYTLGRKAGAGSHLTITATSSLQSSIPKEGPSEKGRPTRLWPACLRRSVPSA